MKKLILTLILIASVLSAAGADLTQGHIFTPGEQNITHVEMNEIAGAATINTTFFTDKSSLAPSAADVFLYYSVANTAYRKTTLNSLLLGNAAIITGQSEDGSPAANDFLLTYDTSGGTLRKVSVQNLMVGSTNLFLSFPQITTPDMGDFIGLSHGVTNAKVTVSDFLLLARTNFDYTTLFTNLPAHTAPTNQDSLLVYDRVNGTNKQISLIALQTNLPSITALNATDLIGVIQSGTNLAKVTWEVVSNSIASRLALTNAATQKFTSIEYTLPGAQGTVTTNHHLTSTPIYVQWVLVCKTNDLGYIAGDEINAETATGGSGALFVTGRNITNIWVYQQDAITLRKIDGTGGYQAADQPSWKLKGYAEYLP